jgi:fatty acid desaturase
MSTETGQRPGIEPEDNPYKRGYTVPAELRSLVAEAHQTRLGVSVLTAFTDNLCVAVLCIATGQLFVLTPLLIASAAAIMTCAIMGRQLRGLECLVHEASHFNWSRKHRKANDVLSYLLAGVPTGARISDYRVSHLLHHGRFGTESDPDLMRYRQLGLEDLERRHLWSFTGSVLVRLPRYQAGWLSTITANPLSILAVIVWFAAWVIVPTWLIWGPRSLVWVAGSWFLSYTLVLPVIRFVGESGEHAYSTTQTVFGATISNIGFWHKILFHPHNDGYHTVHHMWPGVPHHRIKSLHTELMIHDTDSYAKEIRYRTHVLQSFRIGAWH